MCVCPLPVPPPAQARLRASSTRYAVEGTVWHHWPQRQARLEAGAVKILYIEDNEDNVYMLRRRLERAGFAVVIASNGTSGIAMASSEQPDLILMDLSLPDVDGWEATRRIKANPATKHIPVIAITANAMTGDKDKALAAGCDDFDTKPVEIARLLGKIS